MIKAHTEHVLPVKIYLTVAIALFTMTVITVTVSYIDLGGWNAIVALAIATIKALMVAFIFMHLLYDKKINLFIFSMGLVFIGIFISLTMFDTLRRSDIYEIQGESIQKDAVIYEQIKSDSTKASQDTHH